MSLIFEIGDVLNLLPFLAYRDSNKEEIRKLSFSKSLLELKAIHRNPDEGIEIARVEEAEIQDSAKSKPNNKYASERFGKIFLQEFSDFHQTNFGLLVKNSHQRCQIGITHV